MMSNMNRIQLFLASIVGLFISLLLVSCAENNNNNSKTRELTFKVFECNEPFSLENSASARFVSENAEITIWELVNNELVPVKVIKTDLDGTAKLESNNPIIYYSVSKTIKQEGKDDIIKQNLYFLAIKEEGSIETKYLRFQIDGIFTSEDDIATHARFNISPEKVKYIPHVGTLKLKDINEDNLIDERDAVEMSSVNIDKQSEEIVYLSGATIILN